MGIVRVRWFLTLWQTTSSGINRSSNWYCWPQPQTIHFVPLKYDLGNFTALRRLFVFIRFYQICQVRQKMADIIYSAREFYFQEFHFINFSNLALNDLSLHRFPQFLIRKGKFISKWCTVHCEENYAPSLLRFLWTELTF